MTPLDIDMDGRAELVDLQHQGAQELVLLGAAALPGLMKPSGKPAVLLKLKAENHAALFALTSLALLQSACNAFCARYGDPTREVEPGASLVVSRTIRAGQPFTIDLTLQALPCVAGDRVLGFASETFMRGDVIKPTTDGQWGLA